LNAIAVQQSLDRQVLILAPTGKDGTLIEGALRAAGVTGRKCVSIDEVLEGIEDEAGAAVIAEEALNASGLAKVMAALSVQAPWSDFPILLLARSGAASDTVARTLQALANVQVIERPTQVGELASAARIALRGRQRQYQIRDSLEALAERESQLRESDRRKDEFLAMLAHELRNPLQPIGTAADVLRTHGESREAVGYAADVIDRQVRHLSRLLEDLLDVSRITTGKIVLRREPVELCALARRVVEGARSWFETRGHHLTVAIHCDEAWADGDPARLYQILSNLLHNAAKYTPEGGDVRFSIRVDAMAAHFMVEDNGVGIDAEVLPHIFELFTQADRSLDRSAGGLGIGLRIVQKLAELHGGQVAAESNGLGKGSRFTMSLPTIPTPHPDPSPSAAEPAAGAPLRILVVDDNLDAAMTLAMVLELNGHKVDTAHDGLEAIQRAREFRPDVVVLDIGLPGASGYDVARAIRAEPALAGVRLVAVTGYGREEDRRRCQDAGFDLHLVKPLEPSVLLGSLVG
jgi:signal transduction histidine kinase